MAGGVPSCGLPEDKGRGQVHERDGWSEENDDCASAAATAWRAAVGEQAAGLGVAMQRTPLDGC